jgi:hypothetical protein
VGRLLTLVLALGLSGAGAAIAAPATHEQTPNRDRFTGVVSSASGRFAGDRGRVEVILRHTGGRRITLSFSPLPCRRAHHCLRLSGRLRGTMSPSAHQGPPDTGSSLTLHTHGRLAPLGASKGTGTAYGTGFIRRGREALKLTLTADGDRLELVALSGEVRGFTSP